MRLQTNKTLNRTCRRELNHKFTPSAAATPAEASHRDGALSVEGVKLSGVYRFGS